MFNQEDLQKCQGLKKIIDQGKFELKGDATIMVALLFKWFADLESRIKADVEKSKPKPKKEKKKDGNKPG